MSYGRAAVRYAKSLIEISLEQGKLEAIKADMELIHVTCVDSRELVNLLDSPVVNTDKKLSVLNAIFGTHVSDLTKKFIALLTDKGRESLLDQVTAAFEDQYLEHKNILRVVIKSVDGVNDSFKDKVASLIEVAYQKDSLILEEKDKDLIGGFILTIGDKQVDASISRQLADLEKEFSDNKYSKEY
ncbi:MAG: F-type H+-transporting ATPase subunit delta [Flavobacteriales bacterium]|jgi:F-type H+-transporting ATPase subunit delta|tara:strand:- start:3909 stop:4466 length:558 start_codon:yes stop_codon:yes gene_type:complete